MDATKVEESQSDERGATERIYREVFAAIVDHRLRPGTQLKEDSLCEVYGVGRTRIRSVLARLAKDHIVDLIPNRGAFVAQPTAEEAREVFKARRLIEAHLAQAAAANPSKAARRRLRDHLEAEAAARAAGDESMTIRLCGQFHLVLAEVAESPIIARFLRELVSRTSLIVAIYESERAASCEMDEHRALAKAVMEGRAAEAARLMAAHLDGIEARLDLSAPQEGRRDIRDILTRRSA